MAEQTRAAIASIGGVPRPTNASSSGIAAVHTWDRLALLEQPVDEGVEGLVVRRLREHEVERVRAEGRSGHGVPVGDDPEVERLVSLVGVADQGGGDPEEQVVARLVTRE